MHVDFKPISPDFTVDVRTNMIGGALTKTNAWGAKMATLALNSRGLRSTWEKTWFGPRWHGSEAPIYRRRVKLAAFSFIET